MNQTKSLGVVMFENNDADAFLWREFFDSAAQPYQMEVVSDGEEALRFVRDFPGSGKSIPSMFLVDLNLPMHDGLEVLRAIRETPALSNVPVAVLTGAITSHQQAALAELSPRFIRIKPILLDDFKNLAQEILDCANQQRRLERAATYGS